jgi:hypothetical protein
MVSGGLLFTANDAAGHLRGLRAVADDLLWQMTGVEERLRGRRQRMAGLLALTVRPQRERAVTVALLAFKSLWRLTGMLANEYGFFRTGLHQGR